MSASPPSRPTSSQHLLELFIQYQIPSDLLSFEGDAAANATLKVGEVRRHVSAILSMIGDAEKAEVEAAKQKAKYDAPHSYEEEAEDEDSAAPRVRRRSARLAPGPARGCRATTDPLAPERASAKR